MGLKKQLTTKTAFKSYFSLTLLGLFLGAYLHIIKFSSVIINYAGEVTFSTKFISTFIVIFTSALISIGSLICLYVIFTFTEDIWHMVIEKWD